MAKSPSGKSSEDLKGLLRKQKSIIKNLRKEVSRKDKRQQVKEDYEEMAKEQLLDQDQEVVYLDNNKDNCPSCGASLDVVDLVIKNLIICSNGKCKFRKTTKK